MSHSYSVATALPNFQLIFNNALKAYEKRTKKDLLAHPLAFQLRACHSPSDILAILHQQAQGFDQSQSNDDRMAKWLDPTVNILFALSVTLGEDVGLVFSPTNVIFTGVGVLLSAARDVRGGQDILVDVFERIGIFFRRLEIYTEVTPTAEMIDTIVRMMVEVLSILGIATREINQSRLKKYGKKLIGKTHMKDALKMLDELTREVARMATMEVLRATHSISDRVRGIDNRVLGIDDRVHAIDNKVHGVDELFVDDRAAGVKTNVTDVIIDDEGAKQVGKETTSDVDQVKQDRLRENIHKWLSPPDPSTNHNIACGTHHKKPATWFFQGSIFREWKSTNSLLWIHGKPGCGKSVLCSTIIQDIEALCEAGEASMAYFYFDFRDANKQGLRDLVPSLLTQLSARSIFRRDILSKLYSIHDSGKTQPSDGVLIKCLKDMLTLPDRHPIYLIMDALDESPNASGIPSPREMVLQLLGELVDLRLPNLHICVTSRPEIDIRDDIVLLTPLRMSLHDESGQKGDIADYVRSVVYSNSEPIIRRWKKEDKELVIEVLSERADGMFRWVFCQLDILRHCLPSNVRRFLEDLPESLDETYERVLKEIRKPNRDHARRLLQCLVVAFRPLRVEELAEVLAVDFDDTEGIPKLNPGWRWEDEEQALLTSCSSLIAIVGTGRSRVVQFSHFSVGRFLTSTRLATSSQDVSRYYIDLEPAHTVMAQACLSILHQPDDRVRYSGVEERSPLAGYATEHWVDHARFRNVSPNIQEGIERLFERDRAHFAAWIKAYNLDRPKESPPSPFTVPVPLYYAALCGFYDIAGRLVITHPQDINARGGRLITPLHAAIDKGHVKVAQLLLRHGADVGALDDHHRTPLHLAAECGDPEVLLSLLDHSANPNARSKDQETPLFLAARMGRLEAARLLSDHVTDMNHQDSLGRTPLHVAAENGHCDISRLLLDRGADINLPQKNLQTPLHLAADQGKLAVARLLLERGAEVNARDNMDWAPLHCASQKGHLELVLLFLEHDADALARNQEDHTFLEVAWASGHKEIINSQYEDGQTALHIASNYEDLKLMHWLIHDCDVKPNVEDEDQETPLFPASRNGMLEATRLLLDAGADVNHRNWQKMTALHRASENGHDAVTRFLLDRNAAVDAKHAYDWTPLHLASWTGKDIVVKVLLDGHADVNAKNDAAWTPLHMASQKGHLDVVNLLLNSDADVNAQKVDEETALHVAAFYGHPKVVEALLKKNPGLGITNIKGETPQKLALKEGHHHIAQLLGPMAPVREGG